MKRLHIAACLAEGFVVVNDCRTSSVLNLAAEWLGHEGRAANLAADRRQRTAHVAKHNHWTLFTVVEESGGCCKQV